MIVSRQSLRSECPHAAGLEHFAAEWQQDSKEFNLKSLVGQLGSLLLLAMTMAMIGCTQFGERSRPLLGPMTPQMAGRGDRSAVSREPATPSSAGQPAVQKSSGQSDPTDVFSPFGEHAGPVDSLPNKSQFRPVSGRSSAALPNAQAPLTSPPLTSPSTLPNAPPELPPVVNPLEMPRPKTAPGASAVIRGQSPSRGHETYNSPTPGTGEYWRFPMVPSGAPVTRGQNGSNTVFQPFGGANAGAPTMPAAINGPNDYTPILPDQPTNPGVGLQPFNQPSVDFIVNVEEARTGRFMFGAGVNSDLGVTGQIVIDERNFDPWRLPTSWDDVINGTAWRGDGQGFRLEAMPGSQVQRYMVSHTMPYMYLPGIAEPFSLNNSGFYYTRRFFDWNEQRLGGRVALGYRVTPDLSLITAIRAEEVTIFDPRVVGLVPQLDRVVGQNELYSGRITLIHDTRDNAFLATQGHYLEMSYEQAFGSFDYPRGELDYRQYFLMRERPDTSGRHTLAYSFRLGFSGPQTPIYENYFSGGYSTMRGFDFRGASPVGAAGVAIGGQFRFLGSVEYFFPITADDMIKGVVFCDYGTTEEQIELHSDNYRVSPGMGLRLNIPAMGPAPLALDFAIPVTRAPTDNIQNFSFFFGFSR